MTTHTRATIVASVRYTTSLLPAFALLLASWWTLASLIRNAVAAYGLTEGVYRVLAAWVAFGIVALCADSEHRRCAGAAWDRGRAAGVEATERGYAARASVAPSSARAPAAVVVTDRPSCDTPRTRLYLEATLALSQRRPWMMRSRDGAGSALLVAAEPASGGWLMLLAGGVPEAASPSDAMARVKAAIDALSDATCEAATVVVTTAEERVQ